MEAIQRFEETTIVFNDDKTFATSKQLQELYGVTRRKLEYHIKNLKADGLAVGTKMVHTATDGKNYGYEVYNLDEIINIGFRLRSPQALSFQKWAREVLRHELLDIKAKLQLQQYQLDRLWDESDKKDLYR